MATGRLPDDGQLQFGRVVLPAGRRVRAEQGTGQPVAWVTRDPVPDAGRVWSALSDPYPETGLVPVEDPGEDEQGLIFDGLSDIPSDVSELDGLDAAQVLRGMWDDRLPSNDAQWDGPRLVQARAPFSREFPGLAPAEDTRLSRDRLDAALASQPPARVGCWRISGGPGCCTTLRNARFGELLQHISGGAVLIVAAALTRVLAVEVGLCKHLLRDHGRISGTLTCVNVQDACHARFAPPENSDLAIWPSFGWFLWGRFGKASRASRSRNVTACVVTAPLIRLIARQLDR